MSLSVVVVLPFSVGVLGRCFRVTFLELPSRVAVFVGRLFLALLGGRFLFAVFVRRFRLSYSKCPLRLPFSVAVTGVGTAFVTRVLGSGPRSGAASLVGSVFLLVFPCLPRLLTSAVVLMAMNTLPLRYGSCGVCLHAFS